MASFAYVAKTPAGEEVTGFQTGGSVEEVVNQLHGNGLIVLQVREDSSARRGLSWQQRLARFSTGRVGTRDLALFTRQMAALLEAGIPLARGLRGLASDAGSRILARTAADVADRIESGQSLSESMEAHPEAFNGMYVSMIRAGEQAGALDDVLDDLATYLEKVEAIQTKVRSALSYPVFVLIFALLATGFLLFKVVPTFAEIYGEMGQNLPAVTVAVLAASNAIRDNVLVSLGLLIGGLVLLHLWMRTRSGRYARDAFLIGVPIFGPIVRKAVMSRFARTLGILIRSGLPLLESLELVGAAVANATVRRAIGQARQQIAVGQGITSAFRATGKFPEMVLQLMATGEESGELDAMLVKTSDFYDRQVAASVHGLTSLIEPLMIVIVGGVIGVIVVSMFLPIFYLGDAVMKGGVNL